MNIVIAPDSFKECLEARRVAEALARGIRHGRAQASIRLCPMADGGEGAIDVLTGAWGARILRRTVTGPAGTPVQARWALMPDNRTAVIEMAEASGLALLNPSRRQPLRTTTLGTGQSIAAALDEGAQRLIVCIGGSATVDGGCGMARALGVRFLDDRGRDVPEGGGALASIDRIDIDGLDPRLRETTVEAACDVDNPLCGPRGAARTYAPQKGAGPDDVERLEDGLRHLGDCILRDLGVDVRTLSGAGAAGGLGAGLVAFLGATLRPGVELIAEAVGLDDAVGGADLVITGEGRIDDQSLQGKVPVGVARVAKRHGVPVVAVCGEFSGDPEVLRDVGIDAAMALAEGPMGVADSIERADELLERAGRRAMDLVDCGLRIGRTLAMGHRKIVDLDMLVAICRDEQARGRAVGWTNGCFDILHPGHILYLGQARREADLLVVGVNSDRSIRAIKGPDRPINDQRHRAEVLSELASVDYVVIFDDDSPLEVIRQLKPDVYIKGGDYAIDTIDQQERRLVEGYGGRIALTGAIEGTSTTQIIDRIKNGN